MRRSLCALAFLALAAPRAEAQSGLKSYQILGGDKGKISLVDAHGKVLWDYPVRGTPHDIVRLANGNILFIDGAATVKEVAPDKSVVWTYESKPKPGYKGRVEIHAVQRLDDDTTMIAESGNARILEVDRAGTILKEVALKVEKPSSHSDTRLVRKLANGNYLVCQENDGAVKEYDASGKVVWSYTLGLNNRPATSGHAGHGDHVYGALRKPDGNTLIAAGNGNRVIEVDPSGKVVWSVEHDELPGVTLHWVTTLKLLPSGNLILGNCHAGPNNPQLIEVTRDKKVAWTYTNFATFGNDLAVALVLDESDRHKSVQAEAFSH